MLYLERFLSLRDAPIDIVDFAPAPSLQKYLKSNSKINYRSADLYMEGVDDTVDITNMKSYRDDRFDFFVCSHILEHVDDNKALKELYRILKPGGSGILMTPIIDDDTVFDEDLTVTDIQERWRRFAQDDHVRLYSKSKFLERVRYAGFETMQLGYRDLGLLNFLRYGISLKSVLYIVSKAKE
jgi:predicted SAM-dependent methyltransferase